MTPKILWRRRLLVHFGRRKRFNVHVDECVPQYIPDSIGPRSLGDERSTGPAIDFGDERERDALARNIRQSVRKFFPSDSDGLLW